jgi:hypothetical protein
MTALSGTLKAIELSAHRPKFFFLLLRLFLCHCSVDYVFQKAGVARRMESSGTERDGPAHSELIDRGDMNVLRNGRSTSQCRSEIDQSTPKFPAVVRTSEKGAKSMTTIIII